MPNQRFRFKQFVVYQDKSAMKVGTDGVLLGAWANIGQAKRILDIGTGTGLIAIMLAQRSNAIIHAVEIDEMAARQAQENMNRCRWSERLSVHNAPFQEFAQETESKYQLIVSNPPYFIKSHKSPSAERSLARHTDKLPYPELLHGIDRLLDEGGRFCGIFPYVEGNIFVAQAASHGLFCNKRVNVLGKQNGPVKRLLLEFSREKQSLEEDTIAVRGKNDDFTPEYIQLTKDFYLAF